MSMLAEVDTCSWMVSSTRCHWLWRRQQSKRENEIDKLGHCSEDIATKYVPFPLEATDNSTVDCGQHTRHCLSIAFWMKTSSRQRDIQHM